MKEEKVIHPPGVAIILDLRILRISQRELAKRMGIDRGNLNKIITGKKKITVPIALSLERNFVHSAQFWMEIQIDYDLYQERKKQQRQHD